MEVAHLVCILWEEKLKAIAEVGGSESQDNLGNIKHNELEREAYQRVCAWIGAEEWDQLSEEAYQEGQLWIWVGCCMHIEVNMTKREAGGLSQFWVANKPKQHAKQAVYNKSKATDGCEWVEKHTKQQEDVQNVLNNLIPELNTTYLKGRTFKTGEKMLFLAIVQEINQHHGFDKEKKILPKGYILQMN